MKDLPDISLGGFHINAARFTVTEDERCFGARVSLTFDVRDASSGSKTVVSSSEVFSYDQLHRMRDRPGMFAARVRAIVLAGLAHEVDEWLRIDGKQVSNPHPDDGARDTWLAAKPTRSAP